MKVQYLCIKWVFQLNKYIESVIMEQCIRFQGSLDINALCIFTYDT